MNTAATTMFHILLFAVQFFAGIVLVAEAANKLERTDPYMPEAPPRPRLVVAFKLLGWYLLAMGGAGALVSSMLPYDWLLVQAACTSAGFACLIVRTRLKEPRPTDAQQAHAHAMAQVQQAAEDRRKQERRSHDDVHA